MNKELAEKLLEVGRVQGMVDILGSLDMLWAMDKSEGLSEEYKQKAEFLEKELESLEEELIETGTLSEEAENSLEGFQLAVAMTIFVQTWRAGRSDALHS